RWQAIFQSDTGATFEALDRAGEAETLYTSALEKSRASGDRENLVRTLARLAALYRRTARAEQARPLLDEALAIARRMDYKKGLADIAAVQGDLAQDSGDFEAARRSYAEARRLYAILHDPLADRLQERLTAVPDRAAEGR
ncbi:MAG: tetratricopeptide repeat protein, partial [Anaerolineae bacterium]|nr:tetratricopeptide repeat protein [Anaerolineae bacterium]